MTADATNERINRRVAVLERLLEEKGVLQPGELDPVIENFIARAMPLNGARLVARAWLDDDVRRALLADAGAVAASMGMPVGPAGHGEVDLRVVENTDEVHNVIVCTLCSCYPLRLLGTPPSWYKTAAYRSRRGPGPARRAGRVRACSCPRTAGSPSGTAPPTCGTWCCPGVRRAPRA